MFVTAWCRAEDDASGIPSEEEQGSDAHVYL